MDTFQGKSEGLEPQLASKDLQASKPIISSSSSLSKRRYKSGRKIPIIAIECRRCLSVSSPVVIADPCMHRFCVKCILFLWGRQKRREPCVCPLDGEKMICLHPPMNIAESAAEEITGLVDVYNPMFNPRHYMDMAETQLARTFTRFYCLDLTLLLMGALAYCFKCSKASRT
ncbi:unnamed protein product [Arabidopsis thaliana]|uniref:RING-type domain-containing protein n=1 Tax=Arabidopsis thaliana TaxID=3702 RepID=A0A5S9X7U7_ARATH|nr:unnamed protein product [Arabidopsis thaliana]